MRRLPVSLTVAGRVGRDPVCEIRRACVGYLRRDSTPGNRKQENNRDRSPRGAPRTPENTLASLEQAIEIGCDYVELDVRRTKDGVLVIMHDTSVNRMTNGKGKVARLTLAEIRQLEVKSRHGAKWAGWKMPTFDEMLERAKGHMKSMWTTKRPPPPRSWRPSSDTACCTTSWFTDTLTSARIQAAGTRRLDHARSSQGRDRDRRSVPRSQTRNAGWWYCDMDAITSRSGTQERGEVWVDSLSGSRQRGQHQAVRRPRRRCDSDQRSGHRPESAQGDGPPRRIDEITARGGC